MQPHSIAGPLEDLLARQAELEGEGLDLSPEGLHLGLDGGQC